jgi:hypothetical protein
MPIDSQVEASLRSLGHLLEGKMKQTKATTVLLRLLVLQAFAETAQALTAAPAVEQRAFELTDQLRREETRQRDIYHCSLFIVHLSFVIAYTA